MTESFDPKFRDLGEIFEASTKQHADRPLFGTKQAGQWLWLSYGEFRDQVERARAALAGLGVQKGDRVAVISDNRPEWAVGAYACYGLAAAYVPMYEAQRDKDWQFILDNCGAKVLFVANERIASCRCRVVESPRRVKASAIGTCAEPDPSLALERPIRSRLRRGAARSPRATRRARPWSPGGPLPLCRRRG